MSEKAMILDNKSIVFIIVLIVAVLLIVLFNNAKQQNQQGQLLSDLNTAKTIAWISPHNDDEMLASGAIALASLGLKNNVFVITQEKSIVVSPGTKEDRLLDNKDVNAFLELKSYIFVEDYAGGYSGTREEKFEQYLKDFKKTNNLDVILTFENTNGFGNAEHVEWSKFLTKFAIENNIKLYYLINRDPAVQYNFQGDVAGLDPLPVTDTIDLDKHFVVKNGNALSLWKIKVEVVKIYSSSQPNAFDITVVHPERILQLLHEENYRKTN